MVGKKLSHYRILELIGAGGMGVVYRAHDEQLDRDVAIKVLPHGSLADEAARRRFRKEALSLARLNHPNIATVHEFSSEDDIDFLVTEYVAGTTLDAMLAAGPIPGPDVFRLGVQLAQGLSAAHQQGIVHRDLKPGNLRLTADRRLKILDFGLAQFLPHPSDLGLTTTVIQSQEITGTLPYMAPEQLRGEMADARTDLWAAGAVLYEMATGQRPFPQTTSPLLINAILNQAPESARRVNHAVLSELDEVIRKCLAKDPASRYQTASDLALALELVSTSQKLEGQHAAKPSLAVLPLENLSRDPEQDYLADGLTEALITKLAKISALQVTSRTTVMHYKGTHRPIPDIARELGVSKLVEGTVQRFGNRICISAKLIDGLSDTHLWAESYERDLRDLLIVQSEIARAVVREIRVKLMPQELSQLTCARRVDPEAYDAYLRGCYYWNLRTLQGYERGAEYFRQAIEKDSSYAGPDTDIAEVVWLCIDGLDWLRNEPRFKDLVRSLDFAP